MAHAPPAPSLLLRPTPQPALCRKGDDPKEFWHAWAAGAAATVDTFAPDWEFWSYVDVPLGALRERWSIPAAGLQASN